MTEPQVLAAGGVVTRQRDGRTEVLLVHRPAYDDWSLPKGKLDPGEDLARCAVREVHEETGVSVNLGPHLGTVDYRDRSGRHKRVHWWAMDTLAIDERDGDHEVDEIDWLTVKEARRRLTYRTDRHTLAVALEPRRSVLVVRHGSAGKRGSVDPDHKRPLDKKGRGQARRLVDTLADHAIDVIVTSPYKRCRQTVKPLAKTRGLEVVRDDRLAEGADPWEVHELLAELPPRAVLCSHGDVITDLVGHWAASADTPPGAGFGDLRFDKGSTWWVTLNGMRARAATWLPPA